MNKDTAERLVQETLQNSFDKERFTYFVRNLLNHIKETPQTIYRGNFIPDAYEPYIKTLDRIGKYEDPEKHKIDILIVRLRKQISLERARTMQRNFVAWYLNGSRGGVLKDAALAAFVAPDEEDWRFSFIKMEYKLAETLKGNIRAKEEFTPARRYSFLVGKNETSHTAQSQFVPILLEDEHDPTLKQVEEAFGIEKVTKEFFEKYRELFLKIKESLDEIVKKDKKIKADFKAKSVDTVNFTKKLLGQIVFLYFLQKKGWFGVARDADWGTGPKNFLRQLFDEETAKGKNFFNDSLELLFYEALAVERTDDFYGKFNCKIPFLNGGLFDPINNYDWVHTDILLANELFSNTEKTKQDDTGTGILNVFDRYNFTVKEDEPLEKEVAIDPEMLGKTFEKLGAITPDKFDEWAKAVRSGNKKKEFEANKKLGIYYTPREIVHYMCQQSLANYLATEIENRVSRQDIETLVKYGDLTVEHDETYLKKTAKNPNYKGRYDTSKLPKSIEANAKLIDEKLALIRVCDPAIGSGAFLVEMMSEIVRTRNALTNHINGKNGRTIYNFKRKAIQNCLYGVDIDPGAVEIAKLRLWLSLIVDEEDIQHIKPLPNLDYKIMQGNSLLEEYKGIKLFNEKLISSAEADKYGRVEQLKEKQSDLQREYITLHSQNKLTGSKKDELDLKLIEVDKELKRLKKLGQNKNHHASLFDIYSEAKKTANELDKLHKEFFKSAQKTKKDRIKSQIEKLEWKLIEATLKEQGNASELYELKEFRKKNTRPFFLWKLHFNEIFQEKGGYDVVIANPPYIDSEEMTKSMPDLRETIAASYTNTKGNWDIYIAFFELGFRILNQGGSLAFITPDKWISKLFGVELRKNTIGNISTILKAGRNIFESAKVDAIVSLFSIPHCEKLKILNFENNHIVFKNEVNKKNLQLPFAFDFLFSNHLELLLKIESITNKISNSFDCENACATSDAYKLKPLIKDSARENNFDRDSQLKIVNTGTIGKYVSKWGKQKMTYLKDRYLCPVINKQEFLNLFKNTYAKKSIQPKIIIKGLTLLDACLDSEGQIIPGKSTLVIPTNNVNDLKFLLAIINSKLASFYIKQKYPASSYNQGINFTKAMINNLPLPQISECQKAPIIDLINKILKTSESKDYLENPAKQAKVHEYERQIDQMVYKLYDLTPEEIAIVESNDKIKR